MQFFVSRGYKLLLILILSFLFWSEISASNPGYIDDSAQNQAKVCHNVACDDFGIINFELTDDNVVIDSDNGLSGQVWGNELGWITLNPTNSGVVFADASSGLLTGYAWSQVSGWINFAPTGQSVIINPDTGEFEGWAWSGGAYGGWIKFDCSDPSSCVKTTWRPESGTIKTGGPGGPSCEYPFTLVDGACVCEPPLVFIGGGCAYDDAFTDVCSNIPYRQISVPVGMHLEGSMCILNTDSNNGGSGGENNGGGGPIDNPDDNQPDITPDNEGPAVDNPTDNGHNNNSFDDVVEIIDEVLNDFSVSVIGFINQLGFIIQSPRGEAVANTLSTLGIVSGLVVSFLSGILSFTDIGLNLLRLWSFFLYGMGFKRRNRPWGTVYDSITKQPLDPAYVSLVNLGGKEVASSITDLDGRYGFLVEPGTYRLSASKTNYRFPSLKLSGKNSDELYNDLYFGEDVVVTEEGQIITKNIPLDNLKFDWNEFAKKEQKRMKFYHVRDLWLSRLTDTVFFVGFVVSFIVLFFAPKPYNVIIFALYIILFLMRRVTIRRNRKGNVSYADGNMPVSFGILRVKSIISGQEIAHRVLDRTGGYYCLVPNGTYVVSIEKKNEDESYSIIFNSDPILVKNGILKKDFKVGVSIAN